jgi:hypothetical protein
MRIVFNVLLFLTGVFGAFLGYRLATLPNLQPYKLLNIVGLLYSLVAVFVLSEALVVTGNWKKFTLQWIEPALMWLNVTVPSGACIGAVSALLLKNGPSACVVFTFAIASIGWTGIVATLLDLPRLLRKNDIDTRFRYFGLILLASGQLLQLISAIRGL